MTWFKVDDKLNGHPKVLQLGEDGDSDAMALWVLAGSWAAEHETDGWVSVAGARRVDPDHYERRAAALVRVRLWEEAERDGKKGWVFHGWSEPGRQPTKEQIHASRSAKSARQARWREGSRAKNNGPDDDRVDGAVDASTRFDVDADVDACNPEEGLAQVFHFPNVDAAARLQDEAAWGDGLSKAYGQRPAALFLVDGAVDASTRASVDGGVGAFPTRPDPTITTTSSPAPATPAADREPASVNKKRNTAGERADVDALCDRLAELMLANECRPPTITQRWRDEARRMLDLDGREFDKAMALLEWSQKDEFWQSNIHSMPKFREKYDTLRQRALADWKRGQVPGQRRGAYIESDDRQYGSLASAFEPSGT